MNSNKINDLLLQMIVFSAFVLVKPLKTMKSLCHSIFNGVGVRMTQRQNDTVRHFGTVRHYGTEGHFGTATN